MIECDCWCYTDDDDDDVDSDSDDDSDDDDDDDDDDDRYFEILVDDDNNESTWVIDWYIVSIFLYTSMNYRWMDGWIYYQPYDDDGDDNDDSDDSDSDDERYS